MDAPGMYTTIPGLAIRREGGGEVELFSAPVDAATPSGFSRLGHSASYGRMDFQYYIGHDFQLWKSDYGIGQPMVFLAEGSAPVFELHIPLQGSAMSWWDGHQDRQLRRHQFDLDYAPYLRSRTRMETDQRCSTLDLHYSASFLLGFLDKYPGLAPFLEAIEHRRRSSLLGRLVRFLHPAMHAVVHQILSADIAGSFAESYYGERAAILLEMAIGRAVRVRADYSQKKDLEAVVAVREWVERHPDQALTAQQLSDYAGINVSRLHKTFKEFHGVTLFDFSQGVRLEHAQRLLRDTSLFLFEVALECGYPEHSNFTAAFKKRFGITPSEYREHHRK